jgi:preprotein translocase subunit SecG
MLTRLTTWSAVIFMCTSISLVVLFVRNTGTAAATHSVLSGTQSSAPAKSGK